VCIAGAELGTGGTSGQEFAGQIVGQRLEASLTMTDGWAFKRMFTSESQRRKALPGWLHEYNHHRLPTAIGRNTPISRLTNLPGQYT
jgi:transposase InsO family protein